MMATTNKDYLMVKMKLQKLSICLALLLAIGSSAEAQIKQLAPELLPREPRLTSYNLQQRSYYIGVGGLLLEDGYLSPLRYGGYTLSYLSERMRYGYRKDSLVRERELLPSWWPTTSRVADTRWLHHSVVALDYGQTLNPANNASIRRLQLRLERSLMCRLGSGVWGRLYVGAGVTGGLGTLYSSRNGNNPATAKVDLALTANVHYGYQLPWRRFPARVRLSSRMDLLGTAFAQEFGENYYELYEREHRQTLDRFRLIHLGNTLAHQFRLAIDIPVWDYGHLSLGYRAQVRQWTLNHTYNSQIDHTFYFGVTTYIKPMGGRRLLTDERSLIPL